MLTEIFSIAPLFFSTLALVISIYTWKSNRRASQDIQHYSLVSQADNMIADNKAVLRFHGVDPDTIEEKYGINSSELSYLLQSFNSSSIASLLGNEKSTKRFEKGSYRYDILKNEPTQRAFPLIKRLFDSNNLYIARCEKTICFIKQLDNDKASNKNT